MHRTKFIGNVLCVLAVLMFSGGRLAYAEDLFVSAAGKSSGDGTRLHPYWRITDAVVRARAKRRAGVTESITIHIAPGTYWGSYSGTDSGKKPQFEVLPIVLNVPNLELRGSTALTYDSEGLPTDVVNKAPETVLATEDGFTSYSQMLLAIARTVDGSVGDNVSVSGMTFKQPATLSGNAVVADHVSGFAFRGNVMRHTGSAIFTRLSSGVIEGNLLTNNKGLGAYINGGSVAHPAVVLFSGNRSSDNHLRGMMASPIVENVRLDFGLNDVAPVPLNISTGGEDAPIGLDIAVIGNDLSGNLSTGLRFLLSPVVNPASSQPSGPGLPVLRAVVTTNRIENNGNYGMVVCGGNLEGHDLPEFSGTFSGVFAQNLFGGNGQAAAGFTFTQVDFLLDPSIVDESYLRHAVYSISDLDGELARFDYNNPVVDPVNGSPLANTLCINGQTVFGTKVTSKP